MEMNDIILAMSALLALIIFSSVHKFNNLCIPAFSKLRRLVIDNFFRA
jgi:hypothetical protein